MGISTNRSNALISFLHCAKRVHYNRCVVGIYNIIINVTHNIIIRVNHMFML